MLSFRHPLLRDKVFPDFGLPIAHCELAPSGMAELVRACACWESNHHFHGTPLLFTPSKEVLSALPCEASKNPPTASWWRDARLPSFGKQHYHNETSTDSNQLEVEVAEKFSAPLPTTSRSDARA